MSQEKESKILLCGKYDLKTVLENNRVGAFKSYSTFCSDCRTKVLITGESRKMLAADPEIKPVCIDCFRSSHSEEGKLEFSVTEGNIKEISAYFSKLNAKNN